MILNDDKLYKKVIQPKETTPIWRYMTFEKFVNLLMLRQLFFARLDHFPDLLEGTMPFKNKVKIEAEMNKFPFVGHEESVRFSNREEEIVNSYRAFTLANCWSKNDTESLALWKIYLNGKHYGVAIQTVYGNLKKYVSTESNDILFGEVQYVDELEHVKQQTVSLRKILPYEFEKEVRCVIFNQYTKEGPRKGRPKHEHGLLVDVSIENLIERIYLPPLCPIWFEDTIGGVIKKYGYTFDLVHSEIREKL